MQIARFNTRYIQRGVLIKTLRIMNVAAILLTVACLQVSANGFSQNITLSGKNVPVEKVFSQIKAQTGYTFWYNVALIDKAKRTDVNIRNKPLKEALDLYFQDQPFTYQLIGKTIVVKEKSSSILSSKALNAESSLPPPIEIHGSVVSETGEPLAGVSIAVAGTKTGTTTGTDGSYSITAPSDGSLIFSFVGYITQTISVNSRTTIDIKLLREVSSLNDVVVIGYGTQKKRDLTGSIAVVSGDVVAKQPSTNPISSLQGRVAGLTIVNSGQAGSSPTVRIRGVNSTNNADPLYVVDGMLQTNIDYLNPADIQTIEVLKDPSSISIYGLQGGNGVIIITTKRAKLGQTRVSFQSSLSEQTVNNKISVVDAAGFKKLYSAQLANIGAAPFDFTNYTANTNWQNQVLRTALQSNNSLSVSNRTDKSSTYLNVGYSNQQGVLKYDKYEKYIARLNEEIHITKNISVGADLTGLHYKQNPPAGVGDLANKATWAAPIVPIKAGPGLYYAMPSFQRAQVDNPVALIDENNGNTINTGYRVTGNIFAQIKFLKNFTWKSTLFTDLSFNQSRSYTPLPFHYIDLGEGSTPTDTSYAVNPHTSVSQAQILYKTFQQDHTLTFDKDFGSHHITALAGFSTLYHYTSGINGNRTDTSLNIPNDPTLWYLNVAQQSNPGNYGGYASEDASTSYMARVNYSYQGKYLLNVTFRRDGTSKFSPSNQWGNFGSVGAGWIMTDEKFMQNVSWLNFLKLKASWGTVGNGLNIGNYLSYPALNNSNVGIFGSNIYPSVVPAYVPDPNLHWEKVEGKDAGFEARLFNNRLNLDVDLYDRKTHDILTSITLPGASGNTNYFTNLGTIDNKGLEITAGWKDKLGKNFSYSVNGNFSVNNNKVESIGNNINFKLIGNGGVNVTETGNSIGYFYGYVQTGIYQTTAQLDKLPHMSSSAPGDISYADINGDGKIDQKDRTYLGSPFPKYNFGGNVSLNYKDFDLGIDLQGVAGNKIFVQRRTATFAILNYESNRLNAWTAPGTTNVEPILDNTRSNNYLFSSYWLEPGDYLRIRSVQLGYTFSPHILKASGIETLRIYLSGQNLATFTKATGYSPEVPISDPISAGADNGVYPLPAIYSFGLNLTF
ncbi:MAG: TonB-dependent receptor [Bacteroidota bacterium]|nr:TonB-dependent receptor [Bacteroidota bacterium]